MSPDEQGDRILDEYLQGKSMISRIYKEGTDEQPPPQLDAAILAEAGRAVGDQARAARTPFSQNWVAPASLAAVLILTVGLVIFMFEEGGAPYPPVTDSEPALNSTLDEHLPMLPQVDKQKGFRDSTPESSVGIKVPEKRARSVEQGADMSDVSDPLMEEKGPAASDAPTESAVGRFPAAGAAAEPLRLKQPFSSTESKPAPGIRELKKESAKRSREITPAKGLIKLERQEQIRDEREQGRLRKADEMDRLTPAPPAQAGAKKKQQASPEVWLTHILELRKQGRHAEADVSLAEFNKRYPNYPIEEFFR